MSDNGSQVEPKFNGGRGPDGKLLPGHILSRGNRGNRRMAEVRSLISDADARAVLKMMVTIARNENAKNADRIAAGKVLLSYKFGSPAPMDLSERIDALEVAIAERTANRG
jgi:hypothetical protein